MLITAEDLAYILPEAGFRFQRKIQLVYENGDLEAFLIEMGMEDLLPHKDDWQRSTDPLGKILIVGDSAIQEKDIYGCAKACGIEKARIVLLLDYEKIARYDFSQHQYKTDVRLILFGPTPHSGVSRGSYESIISNIENSDGYPKTVRLTNAHGLKISKTSLKEALLTEIESAYLDKNVS
ncbi:MAG: hypothetical protein ACOX3M_06910 [Saccharofermentanales bacterium]|jgi:hypothetical protein